MKRQDRQGVRLPSDVERKWGFKERFDNAMEAAEAASNSVKDLDKQLNQTEIFNRLTNNGKAQGVVMDVNGDVFINASYIVSGILKSLDSETFYLDLVNGILRGKFQEFTVEGKTVDTIAAEKAEAAKSEANAHSDEAVQAAIREVKSYADSAAKQAVDSQTQADIFNKLTNYGQQEGVYIINGQVFINASYISTGTLTSKDNTTFYLDLDTGILRGNFTALSIGGKAAYWKDNGDGTFTLMGA